MRKKEDNFKKISKKKLNKIEQLLKNINKKLK